MDSEKRFFYSNSAEIAVTPFDFSFKYFRTGSPDDAKPGEHMAPVKIDEFTVAMSPIHAKALLSGYFRAIMDYEANVGPIPMEGEQQKAFIATFGPLLKK